MESMINFLSGEVPGGIYSLLVPVVIVVGISIYLYRISEIIDKRKLKKYTLGLIVVICAAYVLVRIENPPPLPVYRVAVFPYVPDSAARDLAWIGTALPTVANRLCEDVAPPNLLMYRPEWIFKSFGDDTAGHVDGTDLNRLFAWAESMELDYLVFGSFSDAGEQIRVRSTIRSMSDKEDVESFEILIQKQVLAQGLLSLGEQIAQKVYVLAGLEYQPDVERRNLFQTPALGDVLSANHALLTGDLDGGYQQGLAALEQDDQSPLVLFMLGSIELEKMILAEDQKEKERFRKQAEAHLKRSGQLDGKFEPAFIALTRYYLFLEPEHDYFSAQACLEISRELNPTDAEIYWLLSFLHESRFADFQFKDRIEVLERTVYLNPGHFGALLELGDLHRQRSAPHDYYSKQALKNYWKAQKLRPGSVRVLVALGAMYDYLGRYEEALNTFDQALEQDSTNADIYYSIGISYYHQGTYQRKLKKLEKMGAFYETAERNLKKAVALSNHTYAYLYLGKIYEIQDRKEEAIEAYRAVMRLADLKDRYREEARKRLARFFRDIELE